jgi:tetratricopeptide (TPR) repeat protein
MKQRLKIAAILVICLCGQYAIGQSKKEIAGEKANQAITHMDNGEIPQSIVLLNEAIKLDPENIVYPYELALANAFNKDYKQSIKILKPLLKHKDVWDQIYQLMGVNYSYLKQPKKAIDYFDKGLAKFPNSGILHLERGNMFLMENNYEKALSFYEKGIKVAPGFPSNYYWASKIYCSSKEKSWGLIYGELFMNLERNSRRTAEISKLLFDTYKSGIHFTSDTSMSVSFCKNMVINIESLSDPSKIKLPFCLVFEPTMLLSIGNEKSVNIASLDRIRGRFIENYFKMGHSKTHPNALFEYNKKVLEAGHIETYNHWILMKGDEEAFQNWHTDNGDKWDAFVKWFTDNPLKLDKNMIFHSDHY